MTSRKIWSPDQDTILKMLKQQRAQKKWSVIARKMHEQFGIVGRTGKQCRQRYHNHLDSSIITTLWTEQEQNLLFQMHEEVGNKWSAISHRLPGRSDNCVKNHFYSKLRKAVRRLNKLVGEHPQVRLAIVKPAILNKIIETTEQRYKTNSRHDEEVIETCIAIKNKLFLLNESQQLDRQTAQLIADMNAFEKKVRKNSKGKDQTNSAETLFQLAQPQIAMPHKIEATKTGLVPVSEPFYQIFKRVCEQILMNESA